MILFCQHKIDRRPCSLTLTLPYLRIWVAKFVVFTFSSMIDDDLLQVDICPISGPMYLHIPYIRILSTVCLKGVCFYVWALRGCPLMTSRNFGKFLTPSPIVTHFTTKALLLSSQNH